MTSDLLWCCLASSVLLPQGKNIKTEEFDAIGVLFPKENWELPLAEEYKNDLAQPLLLDGSVTKSCSNALVAQQAARPPLTHLSRAVDQGGQDGCLAQN